MPKSGSNFKDLRLASKLSQNELSKIAGIEQATISRIERGEMSLLSPHALKLADAMGIPVAAILGFDDNVVPAAAGGRRIPILDAVQAGNFAGVAPYFRGDDAGEYVMAEFDHSSETFAMRVRGDSMAPAFKEGDLIIVDSKISPRPGDFVVATDKGGEATFKAFHSVGINEQGQDVFELVPLNPAYPRLRSDRQPIKIVGVMAEHRSYRRR